MMIKAIIIIATVIVAVIIGIFALRFSSFRNWLVYAVSEAEQALGEKTGQLKLRYAYDLAIGAYPVIAKVIPWALFSWLVDGALEIMKAMINSNSYIAAVITNTENEEESNG